MSNGEVQRAELFANVDELMRWKRAMANKQTELLSWQHGVQAALDDLQQSLKGTIEGCQVLIETDKLLANKIETLEKRAGIANKRIRRLEEAIERLTPR